MKIKQSTFLSLLLLLCSPLTTSGLPIPSPSPSPSPGPKTYKFNLFGLRPVSVNIDPGAVLSKSEPFLYKTTATLASYRNPEVPSREPNRLLAHRTNTSSKVDQNGVPWARPPPAGSVDMEKILDDRWYDRWEELIREGRVRYDPLDGQFYHVGGVEVEEAENEEGTVQEGGMSRKEPGQRGSRAVDFNNTEEILSLVGKKDPGEGNDDPDGRTLWEKYVAGEVDVTAQSLYGQPLPLDFQDEDLIRNAWGLAPAPVRGAAAELDLLGDPSGPGTGSGGTERQASGGPYEVTLPAAKVEN